MRNDQILDPQIKRLVPEQPAQSMSDVNIQARIDLILTTDHVELMIEHQVARDGNALIWPVGCRLP